MASAQDLLTELGKHGQRDTPCAWTPAPAAFPGHGLPHSPFLQTLTAPPPSHSNLCPEGRQPPPGEPLPHKSLYDLMAMLHGCQATSRPASTPGTLSLGTAPLPIEADGSIESCDSESADHEPQASPQGRHVAAAHFPTSQQPEAVGAPEASVETETEPPQPGARMVLEVASDGPVLKPSHDGHHWRRYGRKVIKDAKHPRLYYKCMDEKCDAKKQMQVLRSSPTEPEGGSSMQWITAVTYENSHHPQCTRKDRHLHKMRQALEKDPEPKKDRKSPQRKGLEERAKSQQDGAQPIVMPRSDWAKALLTANSQAEGASSEESECSSLSLTEAMQAAESDRTGPSRSANLLSTPSKGLKRKAGDQGQGGHVFWSVRTDEEQRSEQGASEGPWGRARGHSEKENRESSKSKSIRLFGQTVMTC